MISTSARLLRLLALLSTRPTWTCRELAERMAVTDRTVRRDVARLRELGYGVESEPGPWGGYRLGGAGRVPPLVLDEEEALAVAVALREAALSGVLGGDRAALSALSKLRALLPARVAGRLAGMDAVFVHTPRRGSRPIAPGTLPDLAAACRRGERVRLAYRDHAGLATVRDVDPYRVVYTGLRWYFVARDVDRDRWRTFRADRVAGVEPTGRPAELADPPDAARLVSEGIAGVVYPVYATVRLPHPMGRALRLVPPTIGAHRPDGPDATVVEIGGNDADQLVTYLLGLGTALRVLSPDAVREGLLRRVRELAEDNG
ncbi:helix-turn-helix transcriptional regulator [Actinomadura flavalba]|uniref:helix-turn-helix transcriptional regulator n=1 Tax=Actinomadura flavalba TaxID=1120938 RepID=UPI00038193A1|nr:YafY family protein [Actinomadura flavalba]